MSALIDQRQLTAIIAALDEPMRTGAGNSSKLLEKVAKDGWTLSYMLEDLADVSDRRLRPFPHGIDLASIASAFDLAPANVTYRPGARSNSTTLFTAWSAFDTAVLLIRLEDLGFQVDARTLAELLRPRIPKAGLISGAQLEVLWHHRTRLKSVVTLEVANGRAHDLQERRLASGHRLEILRDTEGSPVKLTVWGPKHRKQPKLVETLCAACGYRWQRGDPDSSAAHRREHARRMPFLDPAPDPNMLAARLAEDDPELVDWRSAQWKQDAMDDRAQLFRQETHYSFVGWGAKPEQDIKAKGYLFTREDGAIVGACAFRWREYLDAPAAWALQWVWVCPSARRQGMLRSRWSKFRELYGDFEIEPPVSDDMQAFVRAVDARAGLTLGGCV